MKSPLRIRSLIGLAWRSLTQQLTRTVLSTLAVTLGVAMIIAASVSGDGFRTGWESEESQQAFAFMFDMFESALNGIGVVILVVAGFLIFNAFAMSINQRRQQIGVLRSLGMARRQVMQIVLFEAAIIGGVGTLLGLIVGPLFGRGLLGLLRLAGFVTGSGRILPEDAALAVSLGLGMTLFSALIPARSAAGMSPLVALQTAPRAVSRPQRTRALAGAGLAIIVALVIYLTIAPPGRWALPPWSLRLPLLLGGVWLLALLLILPALIGVTGRGLSRPLTRLFGASGRLIADNLQRDRQRVTLTILTLMIGLMMIVSLTGFFRYSTDVLWRYMIGDAFARPAWHVTADQSNIEGDPTLDTAAINPAALQSLKEVVGDRAVIVGYRWVFIPEASSLVENFPSLAVDSVALQEAESYTFIEGNWQAVTRTMRSGCGLLVPPGVAARNGVSAGDHLLVTGSDGLVDCVIAGVGTAEDIMYPTSLVGMGAEGLFNMSRTPSELHIIARAGVDVVALDEALAAYADDHAGWVVVSVRDKGMLDNIYEANKMFLSFWNALLLLAMIAAALGVVNTTFASVIERQQELGLLRAVGATRKQTARIVAGEGALMGLLGGLLGVIAGMGVSMIFGLGHGGGAFGIEDLPLFEAAWEATRFALTSGLFGLIAAPLITTIAAWLPVRAIVRGSAIGALDTRRTAT